MHLINVLIQLLIKLKFILNNNIMKNSMKKPLCFVIMGFGEKKDPETNRTINLDETYKKIIRPAVEACNVDCVRADEIIDSGIIDRSMYALLYHADIVIADISTYNSNALYELGARHVLKPHSTIIIKEGNGGLPFDLSHIRTFNYEHLGNEITAKEAARSLKELKLLINAVRENPIIDSPLYVHIPKIVKPILSKEDLDEIIGTLKKKENTIYSLTERAKEYMKEDKFTEAADIWKKLSDKIENEIYYIQQQALCTYKSKYPSEMFALTSALQIMAKIKECNDTETLGIMGAINKRIWEQSKDSIYLEAAIEMYQKGWNIFRDYYTGENYAHCMEEKALLEEEDKERNYYEVGARKVREEIILLISKSLEESEPEELKWKFATLSNCYLVLNDSINAVKYENLFLGEKPVKWEIDTFNKTKEHIINSKQK